MLQKVLKVGNSLGVTLPADFVSKHTVKSGSQVGVVQHNGSITFSTRISKSTSYEPIEDREFFDLVKEVELKYKGALDELANLE